MNRGADRQDVFVQEDDYRVFEWLVGCAAAAFGIEVHSYCLMSNHFHLLIHCPRAGLSEAMHLIEFRYARWFNDRYGRDGPLFRGRFHSVLVDTDAQMVQVSRYIHRNPLAFIPRAGLGSYQWSSYGAFLGFRAPPTWLVLDEVFGYFADDATSLRLHVETDQPADSLSPASFRNRRPTTLDELDSAVMMEVELDALVSGSDGTSTADVRSLTLTLAIELRLATAAVIAERLGLISAQAARNRARRGRARTARDERFRRLRERVLGRLGFA